MFGFNSTKQLNFVGSVKLDFTYRRFLVLSTVVLEFEKLKGKAVDVNTILSSLPSDLSSDIRVMCIQDLIFLTEKGYLKFEISSDHISKTYLPLPKGIKYYTANVKDINKAILALDELWKN